MCDVYFWRQLLVGLSLMMHSLSNGFCFSFPGALNLAILHPNATDIRATRDEASWIAASNGLTGLIGLFILSPMMQSYGRKITHICLNFVDVLGWIMLPFAKSVPILILARSIQGLSQGGIFINCIIMSEYADPKRRGYFMTMKKCSVAVGVLISHWMSLFCTWRQICAFAIVPSTLAVILTLFWPESPAYFAMKGRLADCDQSFVWLHGNSTEKIKELNILKTAQKALLENKTRTKQSFIKKITRKFFMKDFLNSLFIVLILMLAVDICGKYYFVAYVVEIMTELVGDSRTAVYCSIASDFLSIVALILSGIIVVYFKRRTIVFSSGVASTVLMFLISLVEYLNVELSVWSSLKWLTPLLILILIFIINLGFGPVSFTISGEIFPLEHRGLGSCVSGLGNLIFYVLTMKLTPVMMTTIKFYGTYAVYGICLLFCLILLYFLLPETKDKTLQDIEDEMKNINRRPVELNPMLINEN